MPALAPGSTLFPYTTLFRSVKSGVCNATTSNIVTITVDPVAMGGTVNGTTTVCDTINGGTDRKSTRLNSSHVSTSYAVFCLKKKTNPGDHRQRRQRHSCPRT